MDGDDQTNSGMPPADDSGGMGGNVPTDQPVPADDAGIPPADAPAPTPEPTSGGDMGETPEIPPSPVGGENPAVPDAGSTDA